MNELYEELKTLADDNKIVDVTDLVTRKLDIPSNRLTLVVGKLVNKGYIFNKLDSNDDAAPHYILSVPGLDLSTVSHLYKNGCVSFSQ